MCYLNKALWFRQYLFKVKVYYWIWNLHYISGVSIKETVNSKVIGNTDLNIYYLYLHLCKPVGSYPLRVIILFQRLRFLNRMYPSPMLVTILLKFHRNSAVYNILKTPRSIMWDAFDTDMINLCVADIMLRCECCLRCNCFTIIYYAHPC